MSCVPAPKKQVAQSGEVVWNLTVMFDFVTFIAKKALPKRWLKNENS